MVHNGEKWRYMLANRLEHSPWLVRIWGERLERLLKHDGGPIPSFLEQYCLFDWGSQAPLNEVYQSSMISLEICTLKVYCSYLSF